MDIIQILILSFVQGITEFLPISSSAHLILTPFLLGEPLQSLAFDVATHVGTLGAVILYFRRQLTAMAGALVTSLMTGRFDHPDARLALMVILATLPILILGLPLKALLEVLRDDPYRMSLVIAGTSIGFGFLLWWADARGRRTRIESSLGWKDALLIGAAQAVAIIPGTSRSGITITAALMLGLTRQAASRFSFLLAIPTILMAATLETLELWKSAVEVDWFSLILGATLSFGFAYIAIHYFLKFIERVSMLPFVLYRILLGAFILWLIW